jgi:hypothetical protein
LVIGGSEAGRSGQRNGDDRRDCGEMLADALGKGLTVRIKGHYLFLE